MNILNKNIIKAVMAGVALCLTGCNDWLAEPAPGTTELPDFNTSAEACKQIVVGCYAPLAWEYNYTYYSEWYFGDIASDDALKGGQNMMDGTDAYDIDNFKTNPANTIVLDYYRAKYQGIIRCNLALIQLADYDVEGRGDLTEKERTRMLGEVHYLRAFYYFQLVRMFGGVPLVHDVLDSSDRWHQPRASVEDVYASIVEDLKAAESMLWEKNEYPAEDLGRATRGAALAMLCKVHMYMHDYDNAYAWGKKFIDDEYNGGQYRLCPTYADNFTLAGENGVESVFEIQYGFDGESDYGGGNGEGGNGYTRGTFSTILTRPRKSDKEGWGFNHPTHNLYNEFEAGDARRDVAIGVPDAGILDDPEVNYLGSYFFNAKTAYYENGDFPSIDHHSRSPLNYKLIRTSDVLLLYAEAALESGKDQNGAKWALEQVRARARANSAAGSLPAFPGYRGYADNTASLRDAIRHERRVELAMEGHRWFDLVRWGIAAETMNAYRAVEHPEAAAEMAQFIKGKHELFPIPAEEIALNPMEQNPGY